MRVILLNPPGDNLYIRSYYCGATSKSNYLFQPLDLLVLSGRLYGVYEINIIDAIAERLSRSETLKRIIEYKAEVVICVVSIVSWKTDLDFLYLLKNKIPSLIVIANGDVFFDYPKAKLEEHKCIDAIIFDFISPDVIHYLKNEKDKISNMMYRENGDIVSKRPAAREIGEVFSIPIPRHELFLNKNYRFPFVKKYPFTTVLTNFGCPFRCSFCIANIFGFKYRKVSEVMEELRYISALGINEIFFNDMSFGMPRGNVIELCNIMIKDGLNFRWTCFSRVDLMDNEILDLMKKSGCHTIIFGVESANESILQVYKKDYTKEQVVNTFKICRKVGIKTVATFILGLPEDTRETCLDTIKFSKAINCDYASFNIAVPRPGTLLREIAIRDGLIQKDNLVFDHSGCSVSTISKRLSKEELSRLRKRAILEFYLRPSYIFKKLMGMKSFTELREHVRGCIGLLAGNAG